MCSFSFHQLSSNGGICFDVAVRSTVAMTPSQQGFVAAALSDIVSANGNMLSIDGQSVPLERQPEIVYTSPTGRYYSCEFYIHFVA